MYAGPPNTPHWEAREDASHEVLVALYLRDALGIVDPTGLPRMLGTGLPEREPAEQAMVLGWLRWWIPMIEPDAHRWGFPDADDPFLAAVRRHLDSARTWAAVANEQQSDSAKERMMRGDDFALAQLVKENELALGRASRPFRLRIEVLPLAASGIWWIGDDAIAVDETTRNEPIMYRDALASVVEQLV
ncbi:MAG: hypothetical protein ABJA11_00665 [Pseudolysinimonas sp.]